MQYENWHLLLFLTTLLSFALLSISLLSLAVWSNICFKRHVLTEKEEVRGGGISTPLKAPYEHAPVECSTCEFSACVRKIGVDGSQMYMWPLHYRGHKAKQVT